MAPTTTLLKKSLLANAAFSFITGAAALFAAGPIAAWMGLADPLWLRLLGPGLIGFAGLLVWTARAKPINTKLAFAISLADYGWVLGSAALLLLAPEVLASSGRWLVLDIALFVGAVGTAQLAGIGRITRSEAGYNATAAARR